MAKPPPRNDNFVQVYNTGNAPHDLVFILHGEKFKGHQFVFNAQSKYLKESMQRMNVENYAQFGSKLRM